MDIHLETSKLGGPRKQLYEHTKKEKIKWLHRWEVYSGMQVSELTS